MQARDRAFPAPRDIALGMQRGEVHGLCGISWSTIKSQHGDWVKDKQHQPLIQAAPVKDARAAECADGERFRTTMSSARSSISRLTQTILARPFVAPPGIPGDRKAMLRTAFDETMKDPVFLADAKRTHDSTSIR